MEKKEEVVEKLQKLESSPDRDDSLADFKSPKLEPVPPATIKPRILNDKRSKKSTSKSKTSATSRKKENAARRTNNEQDQPSIESSFFRASITATKAGHTCPLCMRYFADPATGTAHSKNCATKNNVSTKKLLAAVALQERQSHERIAIGLPAGPLIQPKSKTPRRNRDLVVSNADPDLQLALALSESLQENELEQDFEEAFLLAAEHRGEDPIVQITHSQKRQTLKNFGFSTNKPATSALTEGPTKSRRKKLLGPTVLQTRTKESRDRILSERIAEILMGNEAITQASPKPNFTRVEKSNSKLQSRLLSKIHQSAKRLWVSAQLSTEITNFYVDDLGPVVLPCVDRQDDNSSNRNANEKILEPKRAQEDYPETLNEKTPESDKNVITNMTEASTNSVNETGENSPPETRNIHVTDRQYRNNLAADWSNTLNVSSMSDVVILVKSTHIWAHKLVFHVRCSDILLDCESTDDAKFGHVKEKICWLDLEPSTAMAFLEFVYCGVIERNPKVFDDNRMLAGIRRLARKYRLKDLFDYLRKRKPQISGCTTVENRREGLSSPVIVDAKEFQNVEKEIEENRAEKRKNQADDTETHETKEIQIEGWQISEVLEVNVERGDPLENIPSVASVERCQELLISPCRKLLEVSAPKSNSPGREIDNDREVELMEVISIASSHRASTMSPDLFDETFDESGEPRGALQNMETSTGGMSQVSIEGDSNLKVLAQLIADDVSSSDETDREFPSLTSPKNKMKNGTAAGMSDAKPIEDCSVDHRSHDLCTSDFGRSSATENVEKNETQNSPIAKKINDRKSLSQNHLETPKSRGTLSEATKLKKLSKSQRSPEKQKSNLSLFIEKIQKINSKPAEDSDSEAGDSFGFVLDRRRFRNPFNVNNVSNEAVKTCDRVKTGCQEMVADEESNVNESSIDESSRVEENDDIESSDDTFSTCDENVSMYSKYKKKNRHNNSISNYRKMLKKVKESRGGISASCEKSQSDISTHDVAIDLTQESDEEIDFPASSSSSVNPLISRKPINRILDTDSNDSSLIRNPCQGESSAVIEKEEATATKNCINHARNSLSVLDRNDERNKTASPNSSFDDKNSQKNSTFFSDIDVFEIDEELLSHSNSRPRQVASSKNSSPVSGKSTPRLRNDDEPINNAVASANSLDNENNSNHLTAGSSEDTRSPNSFEYRDSNGLEANEEIFTQSLLDSEKSPPRNLSSSSHFRVSRRTKSSASKRKSDAIESTGSSLENLTTENEDEQSTDEPGKESLASSPEHKSFDLLERDSKIFTQISINVENRAGKASSSLSTCNEGHTPRKAGRRRSKKRFKKRRSSETSVSSGDLEKTDERTKCDAHELSPEVGDPKIDRRRPEADFPTGNEEIFTQSLITRDGTSRPTTPLSSQETLRIRSPILLSSSPDLGANAQEIATSEGRDSDKENSQKSNESFVVSRYSQDDLMDRFSPVHLEELYSPEACTSRPGCSSRYDYDSSSSVRKLTSRSISMPESTLANREIHTRTETPQRRSRITMSQEFTPPRNYDEMDTPELKRELDRYGIKPQKRKRARQLLNHIYNELHRKVPASSSNNHPPDNAVVKEISDEEEPSSKRIGKINDRNLNHSESDSDVPLSQESLTSPTTSVIPEEMEFPEANISPREMAGPISIKQAFLELMNVDKKLHTQVLTYEPLPFETLFATLKAQGLKCKKNDLMDFLDEECITFRILAQSGKNRTRKKGATGSKRKDKNQEKNKATENAVQV